jgi:hypothetical protein
MGRLGKKKGLKAEYHRVGGGDETVIKERRNENVRL